MRDVLLYVLASLFGDRERVLHVNLVSFLYTLSHCRLQRLDISY